ncbi:MAG: EamA family transporter [Desulfuromonadales bacterium]|nr:EamA family transporter [Desulfuromonadales bacterium]
MNAKVLALILVSVSLSALAQIALKSGMASGRVQEALSAHPVRAALAVAGTPQVVFGLLLYALGAVLWLLVLARIDVSLAYPFVGLGFVLTMVLGFTLLGEPVGSARLTGTLLVTAGVFLVART